MPTEWTEYGENQAQNTERAAAYKKRAQSNFLAWWRQGIAGTTAGYYHAWMDLVSFKLPPELRRRLAEEARRRRVSQAAVIRESLEAALLERPAARGQLTCADLAGDLVGSFRGGPRDLSTNKRYLDEAILADYFKDKRFRRAKKRRR